MKKLFINPEVNSIELTPNDDVMYTSSNVHTVNAVDYNAGITDTINSEYEMWKGVDAWL